MVFSSSEDLDCGEQQCSLIPTVEEVVREEEGQGEDAGSEQQFGVFKDFDFLDVELEDTEVSSSVNKLQGSYRKLSNTCALGSHRSLRHTEIRWFTPVHFDPLKCTVCSMFAILGYTTQFQNAITLKKISKYL